MTILHHARLVLRLVPVVLSLWWADLREPGSALRILRAVAALAEGRRVILVERDPVHVATARRRCAAAEAGTDWKAAQGQGSLFGGAA